MIDAAAALQNLQQKCTAARTRGGSGTEAFDWAGVRLTEDFEGLFVAPEHCLLIV